MKREIAINLRKNPNLSLPIYFEVIREASYKDARNMLKAFTGISTGLGGGFTDEEIDTLSSGKFDTWTDGEKFVVQFKATEEYDFSFDRDAEVREDEAEKKAEAGFIGYILDLVDGYLTNKLESRNVDRERRRLPAFLLNQAA